MKTVTVQTAKPYSVHIGRGLLAQVGRRLAELSQSRVAAVISDDTVDRLYGGRVERSLTEAGFRVCRYAFPCGEKSKNLQTYAAMLDFLTAQELTRADTVVALGGGVPGDLAGFAAATYLRGVRLVQVPTTLLAMVDSSVGGKTGVDLPAGKNLAGAFWQPALVLADPDALETLPEETLADGAAEAIKYGVLRSESLFEQLASGRWKPHTEDVIAECVSAKAALAAEDENDTGRRQLLNLGHTLGHGIERCSHYAVAHGHAVGVGMVYAARIAVHLGLCGAAVPSRIVGALQRNGLPTSAPYTADELLMAAAHDKKRMGETVTLVLPRRIGECELHPVSLRELPALVRAAL